MGPIKPQNSNNNKSIKYEVPMTLQGKLTQIVREGRKPNRGREKPVMMGIQI